MDQEPMRTQFPRRTQDLMRTQNPNEDLGPYEDLEFFDDPGNTQELINQPKFLDFHIMCLIWWNLQLNADLFIIVECR